MQHTKEELARFTDGETRFVYARDRATGSLVYLEDGTAAAERARTRSDLRCIIGDCISPDLTTVARTDRRDGYRHVRRDGIAPCRDATRPELKRISRKLDAIDARRRAPSKVSGTARAGA